MKRVVKQSEQPKPAPPPARSLRPQPGRLAPDDKCDSCGGPARFRTQLVSLSILDFCGPCWDVHSPALARQGAQIIQ